MGPMTWVVVETWRWVQQKSSKQLDSYTAGLKKIGQRIRTKVATLIQIVNIDWTDRRRHTQGRVQHPDQ